VRLVDGKTPKQGRVEVRYKGTWGTICNDEWGIWDAYVVCHMLNYSKAVTGTTASVKGNGPIWLKRLYCTGSQESIDQCYHAGWGNTDGCHHSRDAGVVCGNAINVNVRLVDGKTTNGGRVEVRYKGTWGTICNERWGILDAYVVCHMLNYSKAVTATTASVKGTGQIWLKRLYCWGSEESIDQCLHAGWGNTGGCDHSHDAGVVCGNLTPEEKAIKVRLVGDQKYTGKVEILYQGTWGVVQAKDLLSVRLVDGKTPKQGRVQVRYKGTWGTICNDEWGIYDAYVVCHILNYSKAVTATTSSVKGTGPIWLIGLRCLGSEESIDQCRHGGWGNTGGCDHSRDAGVVCGNLTPEEKAIKVRLVGDQNHTGKVEIQYQGTWGVVCDTSWDIRDAQVICRMLGYKAAENAIRYIEGETPRRILMYDVGCRGREKSIADCAHSGWWKYSCSNNLLAGVVCQTNEDPPPVQVCLAGGRSVNSGRLEVRYHGQWGTVCDDGWDMKDAEVVCRMLGYSGVQEYITTKFTLVKGIIWLKYVDCTGRETSIADCSRGEWGNVYCYHDEDVGVTCIVGKALYFSRLEGGGWWKYYCSNKQLAGVVCQTNEDPPPVQVRLAGGRSVNSGRLEVRYHGQWGTVCDDGWDMKDAEVVCGMLGCVRLVDGKTPNEGHVEERYKGTWGTICNDIQWDISDAYVVCHMLNYSKAVTATTASVKGTGPIWLTGLDCGGSQKSIDQCPQVGWGNTDGCDHSRDAGVVCGNAINVNVRLVDGKTPNEGSVEVRYKGTWGTICNEDWNIWDAYVVCHKLNYSKAVTATTASVKGTGSIWLKGLRCLGYEETVDKCRHAGWGNTGGCDHSRDAGVVCGNLTPEEKAIKVRLVGDQNYTGKVEIKYQGTWGVVCDISWDIRDAHVICRMLGYKAAKHAIRFIEGETPRRMLMSYVGCSGREKSIAECYHPGWWVVPSYCSNKVLAGVVCGLSDK
ncbi:deleted in malignant brain tumors 1 protein-like, partial [Actinia tenebrosa]|uniref:Deleted in malignant brain tumors 1 protein-like n=1 Tax=Actinia tenebrosa TaxID=6105 RepID=A0A6P8HH99_ACTTE